MVNRNTFLDCLDLYKDLKEMQAEVKRLIINNLEREEYEEASKKFKELKAITVKINLIEKMEIKYNH